MKGYQFAPVYAVNLRSRTDRKEHIRREFLGRDEFSLTIVEAEEHKIGATGLWKTILKILNSITDRETEFIILCEDDHRFTADYSPSILFECIYTAAEKGADVLLGGVSWFSGALPISEHDFWVDRFSGLQFTVIFRKFFETILNADFGEKDVADFKIASLSDNKFFIHPFISTQMEFGYSDATKGNNVPGFVDGLFSVSIECAKSLITLSKIYKQPERSRSENEPDVFENISIPTYVIHSPARADRLQYILGEFSGKREFDVSIVEEYDHPVRAFALLSTIKKIVSIAMANDDDVIIVCEDDHQFTQYYSKKSLFENIIDASGQNSEILSGGIGRFDQVVPVTETLFWVNAISHLQFIVLYKSVFSKILDETITGEVEVKELLTQLTSHKMVFFPFISTKKAFDLHDDLPSGEAGEKPVTEQFSTTSMRIGRIREKTRAYQML